SVERCSSAGFAPKRAAGVATVVVGLPAATAVLERNAAETTQTVSSRTAQRASDANRSTPTGANAAARGGSTAPARSAARTTHVRAARTGGGPADGAVPTVLPTPDAEP